jgi:NFU1 iron-sulfur cluster scaffold homolog, mitochondrial
MPTILHISSTPNPLAKKFHSDVLICDSQPIVLQKGEEANFSDHINELCNALFQIDYIQGLFLLDQVVTINISAQGDWEELEPEIQLLLEEYLEEFIPSQTLSENSTAQTEIEVPADFFGLALEEQVSHIEQILDIKVRPGLAGDGGGLQLMGIEGNFVYVYYLGACGSCPSSTTGTLTYITETLQTFAHPDIEVELA